MSKTACLFRMGGIGDCIILTPVARRLNELGYKIDLYVGSPNGSIIEFFSELPYINKIYELYRINGIDCIKNEDGHYVSVEIIKAKYDEVFDYKNSIEENHPQFFMKDIGWRHTINSNYVNWFDMMFAWTNIDPYKLDDSYKRPDVRLPSKYIDYAKSIIADGANVIGIHLKGSTLIRTWYKAGELPQRLLDKYPDYIILLYDGVNWLMISKGGIKTVEIPDGYNPLLVSAGLLTRMKVFISADSGYSHIAEGLGIKSIVLYTTVPAWTRMKYYKHTYYIEPENVNCFPCFTLFVYCPVEMEKAKNNLNEREKDIFNSLQSGKRPEELSQKYNTLPNAIVQEYEGILRKLDAIYKTEPACVGSITIEKIFNKLEEIL